MDHYDHTYDPNPGDDAIMALTQPWGLHNIAGDISEADNLITGNYWDWLLDGAIADELRAHACGWNPPPLPGPGTKTGGANPHSHLE